MKPVRQAPRLKLDRSSWCWLAGQSAPVRTRATDLSTTGIGLLLTPPRAKPGQTIRLQLDSQEGPGPWLTGSIVRVNTLEEIRVQHVGVRLDPVAAAAPKELERALAFAEELPDEQIAIAEWTLSYRRKGIADCASLLPLADDVALPLSFGRTGMVVVSGPPMAGRYCTYLFGTSVATTQPTLCFWSESEVVACAPVPDLAGLHRVAMRFRALPEDTGKMIAATARSYGYRAR